MTLIAKYESGKDSINPTFRTHLNYIKRQKILTNQMIIDINVNAERNIDLAKCNKFYKLSEITKYGISTELQACFGDIEYSQVISPWLPVKCYYRLYYLESILIYLINGNASGFGQGGHTKVRGAILDLIINGEISIISDGATELTKIRNIKDSLNFKTGYGVALKSDYFKDQDCTFSLGKKIAEYIEIDWKMKNKIKDYRSLESRVLRESKLYDKRFTLLDYFYWMRIKANYRDVDFLDFDNEISVQDSSAYVREFSVAYENYANALDEAVKLLLTKRS